MNRLIILFFKKRKMNNVLDFRKQNYHKGFVEKGHGKPKYASSHVEIDQDLANLLILN